MTQIISYPDIREEKQFYHEFVNNQTGERYQFDCFEDGTPNSSSYYDRVSSDPNFTLVGIKFRTYTVKRPLIIKCDCGEELHCDRFTNTCDCGRDYNMSGQLLASREFWGEETGENLSDILRIK